MLDGLREHYGLAASGLTQLGGGLDLAAWTFRVTVDSGPDRVLRLKRGEPRPAAYLVPWHLRQSGVDEVVAPLVTRTGSLFVRSHGLTWSVYPFVEGADGYDGRMTRAHWQRLGTVLRTAHGIAPPRRVLDLLPRPGRDTTVYDRLVDLDDQLRRPGGPAAAGPDFVAAWHRHRGVFTAMLDQMRTLAGRASRRPDRDVLCHGDLHPGNILVDGERLHILDWDDVLLAPKERDLIFVPDGTPDRGLDGRQPVPLAPEFPRGYGLLSDDVDWVALTYHRCERVVQDVTELAHQGLGLTTDDLGTRAGATGWLDYIFLPGGEADSALRAARHLPADLDILSAER